MPVHWSVSPRTGLPDAGRVPFVLPYAPDFQANSDQSSEFDALAVGLIALPPTPERTTIRVAARSRSVTGNGVRRLNEACLRSWMVPGVRGHFAFRAGVGRFEGGRVTRRQP